LDRNDGEYPKAFVVRKHQDVTARELQDFIEQRLSRHKWLTGGVAFIDVVPRTSTGKVIRRALQQREQGKTQKL
jgi:4-coumarate--CoA ligase